MDNGGVCSGVCNISTAGQREHASTRTKAILWWVKVRKGQCGGYAKVRLALVTCGEVRDWFAALEPDREGIGQTSCPRDLATEPSDEEFVSFL